MSATLQGDHFVVTASGLRLYVAPGEYWIGITPRAPSGFFGPEPHLATMTLVGDATASLDPYAFPGPPGWFNFNPGVDAVISVEGSLIAGCDDDDEGDDEGEDTQHELPITLPTETGDAIRGIMDMSGPTSRDDDRQTHHRGR